MRHDDSRPCQRARAAADAIEPKDAYGLAGYAHAAIRPSSTRATSDLSIAKAKPGTNCGAIPAVLVGNGSTAPHSRVKVAALICVGLTCLYELETVSLPGLSE